MELKLLGLLSWEPERRHGMLTMGARVATAHIRCFKRRGLSRNGIA